MTFPGEDPSDKFYVLRPRSAKSRVRGHLQLSHFYAASNEEQHQGATGAEHERAHGSEVSLPFVFELFGCQAPCASFLSAEPVKKALESAIPLP